MTAAFVYDDDCGFCSWWAEFFAERTDLGIVGFAELTDAERERLPDGWEDCAHLLTDEGVYSCGAAIERALLRTDALPPTAAEAMRFLRGFEDYERLRERAYRAGADRRSTLGDFVNADPPARREPGEGGGTIGGGQAGETDAGDASGATEEGGTSGGTENGSATDGTGREDAPDGTGSEDARGDSRGGGPTDETGS